MRLLLGFLLLVALLLAGCAFENGVAPDDFVLEGTLVEDFDDDDRVDLERRVDQRGATVSYMESFPVQFIVRFLEPTQCENLRLELEHVDYVQDLQECRVWV